jgi:hypothetical protein
MNPHYSTAALPVRPRRSFCLCIPFLLVWVLLLPFVLLLAPLVFVACLFVKVDPLRGVWIYWQVFNALRGIRLEVEDPGAPVRIRII